MMNATMMAPSKSLARAVRSIAGPAGLGLRTPIKRLADAAISRLPEGPSERDRLRSRFMIVCDARRGEELRRGIVTGSDVYGLTAALVVKGAIIASSTGFFG